MSNVAIRGVLARLCLGLAEVPPDAELLENYIATRDEAAFASLVERHGPKVFAVCRRLLGQHQLAEDAYQATFVVLAKKAHTIQPRSAVGGFLYGVARKAALEAYAVSRRRKETLVETVPDSPAVPLTATDSDVLAMLDEEIANLSDAYRAAVVLCELDGVGRADAALQLGIAEGTLSSRLAAARKQLASRLKARGVVYSAGLMSSLAISANAAIPPTIATATTAVSLIATGVLRTMLLAKFKLITTVCVLVTAIIGMSTFVPKTSMEAKAAPVPKVEKDEGLLWMFNKKTSTLTAYRPDGKVAKAIPLKDGKHFRGFTPDGSQLMFAGKNGKLVEQNVTDGLTLHLRDINDTVEGTDTGLGCQSAELIVFSPDMKKIVRSRTETMENIAGKDYPRYSHVLFDLATKIETPVDVPNDFVIKQWSADGKSWLAMQDNLGDPSLPRFRWHTVPVAGGKPTPINDKYTFRNLTPSPDGKTLLGTGFEHSINYVPGTIECFNVTGEKATVTPVVQFEKVAFVWLKWSPDGRQMAYLRLEYDPENGIEYDRTLCVCNSDGSDAKKLQQFKNDNHNTSLLGWFPTKIARPKQPISAPVPKEREEVIVAYHAGRPVFLNENGKVVRELFAEGWGGSTGRAMLNKDGRQIAMLTDTKRDATGWMFRKLYVRDIDGKGNGEELMSEWLEALTAMWSPDGKSIVTSGLVTKKTIVDGKKNPNYANEAGIHHRIDIASKQRTELTLPASHQIMDVSPDGKWFLTYVSHMHNAKETYKVCLVGMDGKVVDDLTDGSAPIVGQRFSPDGKKVVALSYNDVDNRTAVRLSEVFILDVAAKEKMVVLPLNGLHDDAIVQSVAWSPDGSRIAFSWWTDGRTKGESKDTLTHVSIATLDDAKIRTIFSVKDKTLGSIDWAKK